MNIDNLLKEITAVDLFCGAGGLTYGLKEAGINVTAGIDIDGSCRYAYETNNKVDFIEKNISEVNNSDINRYLHGKIKILVGCAPCQPFSSQTFKYEASKNHKDRNLLKEFSRIIKEVNPNIISMENVPAIVKQDIFLKFETELQNAGYKTSWKIVFCPNYGIAQNRRRLVLLASKYGDIKLLEPTHNRNNYVKVKDVIGKLPAIKAGETHISDNLHKSKKLMLINIKRIKKSKPKGSWLDWPEYLRPDCYKKESGRTYTSVYGRMSFDDIAPTITTQFFNYGSGRFGHPEQNRALSIREGALLQTFPLSYDFGDLPFSKIGKHIGNAVPPVLGRIIGLSIKEHLKDFIYE